MIPILYPASETNFTNNGVGRLTDCIECTVTEERNGIYEAEFSYPVNGIHYADIQEGMYIACIHDDDGDVQPFEIYRRSAVINGTVTFSCRHLSYKLSNVILEPFTASSASDVLSKLTTKNINTNDFTFWTDKTTAASFKLTVPASVRAVMGGVEGSILDVYGGEWDFDKWTVKLYAHRGTASGVTIRYGKNLTDLTQVRDSGEIHNAVVPYWVQEDENSTTLVMLPEKIVKAAGVTTPTPIALDLSLDFMEKPTQTQLRNAANAYLTDSSIWTPTENITIDFVQLWQTTEYQNVANLLKVRLCDTVDVYYTALGLTRTGVKVISVTYDVLAERYTKMELGQPSATYSDVLTNNFNTAIKKAQVSDRGFMDGAIQSATETLTGANGGYIVINRDADGHPQELLVMDTDDELTATNIIRMNVNGIGFSTDGGSTYGTAWTIGGAFNANYITAGTLRTIKLEGPSNQTFWDLSTGEWQSTGSTSVDYDGGAWNNPSSEYGTWTFDMSVNIDAGVYSVYGSRPGKKTQFVTFGVFAEPDVDGFDEYIVDHYGTTEYSEFLAAYARPKMMLVGERRTFYGRFVGTFDGTNYPASAPRVTDAIFNPSAYLSPATLVLGHCDKLNSIASETEQDPRWVGPGNSGVLIPSYNKLQLCAGPVNMEDSIVFVENTKLGTASSGNLSFSWRYDSDAVKHGYCYRPAWPFRPGDTLVIPNDYPVLCAGYLSSSNTSIYFFIPLSRPISDYVKTITITAGTIIVRQAGSYLVGSADSGASITTYNRLIHWSRDNGIYVRLQKSSGNFGGTNNSELCANLYGITINFS